MISRARKWVVLQAASNQKFCTTISFKIAVRPVLVTTRKISAVDQWTTNRGATKPDEHKCKASGKTVFSCEEPPDNKPLVLNPMKEWSGGGNQSSRANHGNEQTFIGTPMTVLIDFNEGLFEQVTEGIGTRF